MVNLSIRLAEEGFLAPRKNVERSDEKKYSHCLWSQWEVSNCSLPITDNDGKSFLSFHLGQVRMRGLGWACSGTEPAWKSVRGSQPNNQLSTPLYVYVEKSARRCQLTSGSVCTASPPRDHLTSPSVYNSFMQDQLTPKPDHYNLNDRPLQTGKHKTTHLTLSPHQKPLCFVFKVSHISGQRVLKRLAQR